LRTQRRRVPDSVAALRQAAPLVVLIGFIGGAVSYATAGGSTYSDGLAGLADAWPSDQVTALFLETRDPFPTAAELITPRGLPRVVRVARGRSGRSVANRNLNPLNIKYGGRTRRYVEGGLAAISDIVPADGGRFLRFESAVDGFRAAADLLGTKRYLDLQLDEALRTWTNNGYGAEILDGTSLDGRTPVPSLGRDDLSILLNVMATAEGYRSAAIAEEITKALAQR
jgi:hypothetical protein